MVFNSTKNPNAASAQCQPSTIMLFPTTYKPYGCIQNYRIWLAEPLRNVSRLMPAKYHNAIPDYPQTLAPLAASLNNPLTKNAFEPVFVPLREKNPTVPGLTLCLFLRFI
ncbi:uncharacterized protein BDR25DRAFT_354750 [Lindgomyces ingoldianus]|uniref:Uncharacterized protein n=1 Tax=Lindgomyces ingoldianus TaxID=673940 RepID=A0ACB6QXB6_9PLEO|nr:uncharacterized protein BDR25DRAFT_354750 [Lindgomyces ingoldianus]KAF2470841.1 hypothetical protein BDR25DRAFT_354750 [Lindgomyces ingoldianus]